MESCCSVKALVGGVCGYDPKDRKCDSQIVPYCLAIRKSTFTSLCNEKKLQFFFAKAKLYFLSQWEQVRFFVDVYYIVTNDNAECQGG